MNKLVVDAGGGDHAPLEILKGCRIGLEQNPEVSLVVVGDLDICKGIMVEEKADLSRVEFVHASEVFKEGESAASIRTRKETSLVIALNLLREREDCVGLISAGSTGAVLAGAQIYIGRLPGVQRASLLSIFPTKVDGKMVYLTDCGAVVDSTPEYMEQFAIMGNEYVKVVTGIDRPKIALLNVGVEAGKGDERSKAAYKLIEARKSLNFVGNIEARTYISGDIDLLVADGFSGNACMKATEGAGINFMSVFKGAIKSGFWSKVGALLMKKQLKKSLKFMDFNNYGGAYFIGCKKLICKAHGASKAKSISIAIKETWELASHDLCKKIERAIANDV